MKSSELIKRLQHLDKDIPFDAEIVIGDDWQPSHLKRVYHEPPYTFLAFESSEEEVEPKRTEFTEQESILVGSFVAAGLERYKEGLISLELAVSVIGGLIEMAQSSSADEIISFIKRHERPGT